MVAAPNVAQVATAEQMGPFAGRSGFGTLHLQSRLGSFKSIDGEGRLSVRFTGTLLVTNLRDGRMTVRSGRLRKEFDEGGRQVYTGTADVVIDGKWRGVQWFGRDMRAVWWGRGFMRVSGEFVRNPQTGKLETGDYWYNNPEEKMAFPSSNLITLTLPQATMGVDPNVRPRGRRGGAAATGGN